MNVGRWAFIGMFSAVIGCKSEPPLSEWRIARTDQSLEQCDTQQRVAVASHSSIVARPASRYCDITAIPVVKLSASPDGSYPDPGDQLVMTGDNRYYTTSRYGQQVLEWSSNGRFLRSIGKSGEGPGEFSARGGLMLFLGARDSLFVLDGGQRWTVFDAKLDYQRSFQGRFNTREFGSIHVIPGVGILTSGALADGTSGSSQAFHIMSFEGSRLSSFGPTVPAYAVQLSGLDANGDIWVVPPNGEPKGLSVEKWTMSGQKELTIQRDVSWLPTNGYSTVNDPSEPHLPEYDYVHIDNKGLIWVTLAARDPRWRHVGTTEKEKVQKELYDGRVEVLDPVSGSVIASFRYDGPPDPLPPIAFLPGSRRSYRVVEDSTGMKTIEVFDIQLTAKR